MYWIPMKMGIVHWRWSRGTGDGPDGIAPRRLHFAIRWNWGRYQLLGFLYRITQNCAGRYYIALSSWSLLSTYLTARTVSIPLWWSSMELICRWQTRHEESMGESHWSCCKSLSPLAEESWRIGIRTITNHHSPSWKEQHSLLPHWCPISRTELPTSSIWTIMSTVFMDPHDWMDRWGLWSWNDWTIWVYPKLDSMGMFSLSRLCWCADK